MNAFNASQTESAYDDSDRPSGTVLKSKQRIDPRVERELPMHTIPGPAPASAPVSGPASANAPHRVHVRRQTPVRLVRVDASLVERSREVAEFVAAHGGHSNTGALEAYVFATVEITRATRQGPVRVHTTMKPRSLRVASPTPVSATEDADIESTIRATNELLNGLRNKR